MAYDLLQPMSDILCSDYPTHSPALQLELSQLIEDFTGFPKHRDRYLKRLRRLLPPLSDVTKKATFNSLEPRLQVEDPAEVLIIGQ
jgi:hypothetical protein